MNFQVHRQTWASAWIPPPVLNQTIIYDPAGARAAGFVLHAIITFIIHRNPIRSCFPANFHNRGAEKQHSPTPGLGSGSGTPSPLALTRTANQRWAPGEREVPRGWETYGPAWCYVTPQPSPSARRPRCAEPASLSPSPTPLELCHSWLFNLTSIPSLVPITAHLHVQIRRNNNNGGGPPSQFGFFTTGREKARGGFCCGRGREGVRGESLGICWQGGHGARSRPGIYWKINHKSSHLSDRERLWQRRSSCVAGLASSPRPLPQR